MKLTIPFLLRDASAEPIPGMVYPQPVVVLTMHFRAETQGCEAYLVGGARTGYGQI